MTSEDITDAPNLRDIIHLKVGFDPFEDVKDISKDRLSTSPVVLSGVPLNDAGSQYLLRIAFKNGLRRTLKWFSTSIEEVISIIPVIIDEDLGTIEIRADHSNAKRVASYIGSTFESVIEPLNRCNIMTPFGSNIEQFADSLGGRLHEIISTPEEILEHLTDEQAHIIARILISLDSYFSSGDIQEVENTLIESRAYFAENGQEYLEVPFTAIVLAGMKRLGMSVKDTDLREQPLYSILQPYLQHQGGFITYPVVESGVTNFYTIKVGLTTNTVYFISPATEKAIEKVRNKILCNN